MRVLGVDPGTAICGWAVIERTAKGVAAIDYGAIETAAGLDPADRLLAVFEQLSQVIERLKPDAGAVEKLFFGQNSKTALAVGQARGVVLLALARAGIPYVEMTPNEVKQSVTGWGRADKRQIQAMVQRILALETKPQPDDVADALAIAMTGGEHLRYRRMVHRL